MGTKVHCKSFFPGDYTMMNLNEENDSGCWQLYYEDKLFNNKQCFNIFSPQPGRDVYLDNNKEVVRRTMLKHEAIFRNQVYELHRLYSMQMVLMEDLKRQELLKYPTTFEALHSNRLLPQKPSEEAQKISFIPSVSVVQSACSRASVLGTENILSHLSFLQQSSAKADSFAAQNVGNLGDCDLMESKTRKHSRRMLDLQLPADEYIDSDEGDQVEEEHASQASVLTNIASKKSRGVAPENDVKLFLGRNAELDRQGVISNSASHVQNKNGLADLNKPIQVEEASSSASVNNFLGSATCNGGIQVKDRPLNQNLVLLGCPGEVCRNNQKADKGEDCRHEWSSYNLQSGQNGTKTNSFSEDLGLERVLSTSRNFKTEFREAHAYPTFPSTNNNGSKVWSGSSAFRADASEKNQSINSQYLVPPDVSNSVSLTASSMGRLRSSLSQSNDVRGVQYFNPSKQSSKSSGASIQSSKFVDGKWHLNNNLRLNSSFGSESSNRSGIFPGSFSESNVSQDRFPLVSFDYLNCNDNTIGIEHTESHHCTKYLKGLDSKDVKSRKDMNLNVALLNGFEEGMMGKRDLILNGERENEDSLGVFPWFRTKLDNFQQSPSASCTLEAEESRIESRDHSGTKKIFGVPILDKPRTSKELFSQNSSSKSLQSSSEKMAVQSSGKVKVLHIDLSREPALSDSDQQLSMENMVVVKEAGEGISSSRGQFDLNSFASEEEPLVLCSNPIGKAKIVLEIDLEAPPVPEPAEAMIPDNYAENQFKMPTQSSISRGGLQDSTGELAKVAAEALVFISSSTVLGHAKDATQHPSEPSLVDCLNWFADVVSSNSGALSNQGRVGAREKGSVEFDSSDESDYFERMTLELTELKMEEYWCEPGSLDNLNNEENASPSLPTRRRRGQARRGRQRKDFQRDVLPSIASLSRHEVTEDLQTIGGLMRATGHPWQTALERRNAARNGWARGRRRSRGTVSSVAAVATCVAPLQQLDNNNMTNSSNNNELGLEERSLKGWGKTTRRPRCQRFVAGNPPPVPLTQV
ncbi:hypothetical protein Syun_023400 [Stephania yunnanensis]|uniref:Uncharacterized protein n=1 Tax=Stephania yunnanensis TaxID=152371 RepID=A0AAP0F9K8_9MAGN